MRAALLALFILAACHGSSAPEPTTPQAAVTSAARSALRTTDGAIAVGNLEAQIASEERLARSGPLKVTQRAAIADLVATHGQIVGRIADYERALALAEALAADAPADPAALLARARARGIFHRFREASADLEAAERLGLPAHESRGMRATILQALGRYDEALELRSVATAVRRDVASLTAEAVLRGEMGDLEAAERLFDEAPGTYRDVSPFPIAWLDFQRGLMWMREEQWARARELFSAAHERVPAYAAAQGHLAEVEAALGNRARAVALLTPLAETSDDPDYAAQLARILFDDGKPEAAALWRSRAATRYDELIRVHPEAFADHAAEFWLAAGHDPRRGLELARMNLALRPTPRAYELVLQGSVAAGDPIGGCDAVRFGRTLHHPTPRFATLLAAAGPECALAADAGTGH